MLGNAAPKSTIPCNMPTRFPFQGISPNKIHTHTRREGNCYSSMANAHNPRPLFRFFNWKPCIWGCAFPIVPGRYLFSHGACKWVEVFVISLLPYLEQHTLYSASLQLVVWNGGLVVQELPICPLQKPGVQIPINPNLQSRGS